MASEPLPCETRSGLELGDRCVDLFERAGEAAREHSSNLLRVLSCDANLNLRLFERCTCGFEIEERRSDLEGDRTTQLLRSKACLFVLRVADVSLRVSRAS